MATKPRAKMVQRDATLDEILKSGARYQQFAEDHPAEASPPEPSGMARRVLGDGGIALLKGAIGVPEAAVGLADLATGGAAGKMLENEGGAIGFRPRMAKQFLDTYKSPEQQAADKAVQEAQGFVDTTVAALKNPSVVLGSVAESVPMMLGGGVIARSLLRMAPAGMAGATAAPVVAGAAGEGIVAAGSQAESIRQETPDGLLTGEQSGLAAASGLATGFLGYLGGKVAQRLGIADIDTVLAGKAGPEVTKGFTRRVLEGAVAEGLLEELPQSVQEQVAQNMALGRPLGEGVPQAAVLGALAGGLMGGGGNAISFGSQVRREKVEGSGPASKAINAGLEDTAKQADAIEAAAVPPVVDPLATAGAAPAAAAAPTEPVSVGTMAEPAAEPAPVVAALAPRPITEGRKINLDGKDWIVTTRPQGGYSITSGSETRTVPAAAKTGRRIAELLAGGPAAPAVEPAVPVPTAAPAPVSDSQAFADADIPLPDQAAPPAPMEATIAAPIDANANQAATSPANDRPEPTEAQKKAGNYALGHHKLAGLDLSIENPAGSVRRGTDRDGKAWENQLQHHYGYIKGTIGNDKDHVDAFVKPGTPDEWNGTVFVVDQVHPDTGKFDESKVMLGFATADEARQAYQANYAKDWKGLRDLTELATDELKAWVFDKSKSMMPAAQWKAKHGSKERPEGARREQDSALQAVDQRQGSLQQPQEPVLPQLRGAGDQAAPGSGGQLPGIQAGSGATPEPAAYAGAQGQQQGVRAGQPGLGDQEGASAQPAQEPPSDAGGSNAADRSVGGGNGAGAVNAALPRDQGRDDGAGGADNRATRGAPAVEPSAAKQLKNASSSANTPTAPPAPAAGSNFTPANWWGVALPTEREPMLLAAGWKPGSPGLDAMKGKRWDEFTPSQKARVGQAINAKKAAADEATRPQAQAAGAEAPAPAAAPAAAAPAVVPGAGPAGVEAAGLNPETWWEKSLTAAGRHKAMLAAGMAKGDKTTYPDAIRWQYLPLTAQARLRELQASGWDGDKVGAPGSAPAAAPAPAPAADPDAEKKAKALSDLNDALGDLAGIFGKDFKANMLPEQEQKLMPVLTRVMDAAFRAGYYSFKQAARFVLDTIRDRISPEVADSITLDHLQGAYIGMAGKYKDQGATSKRDVVAIESLDELAPEPAAAAAIEQPDSDDDVTMSGDTLMRADASALDMLTDAEAAPMSQQAMDDVANFVDGERLRDVAMFGQQPVRKSFPRLKGEGKGGQLKLPAGLEVLTPEQAKARLDEWKAEARRQGRQEAGKNVNYGVLSLFDTTGTMAKPWEEAGYNVFTYDIQDGQDINEFNAENLLEQHGNDNIMVVIAQPPCTDFASSGARWWAEKDADGRTEASNELVRQVLRTVELFRPAVWAMENPVGRIATQNKLPEPTAAFDPWHFGDDYTKRTQFFGRFNPDMPTAPVFPARGSLIHKMSSSAQKERSDTPEGIAYAFFMANNFAGMGPAGRLAAEFAGVDRALFDRAIAAGESESAIKEAIEDSYYENDLATVREELQRMGGPDGGPASTQLPTPAAAPAQPPASQPPAASTGAQNADDAIPALDQPSPPALAGVPAGEVSAADGERPAGGSAAPGGRVDGGGNVQADRPGGAGGRGLRGGAGDAPVPATGAGSGGGTGADGGVSNPGPADARAEGSSQRRVDPPEFARKDFRITDETRLGEGGAKTKYRQNVAAIRLINELEATGRPATVDEQNVLARYVGWGMLSQAFDPDHKDWTKEYAELKELLTPDEWAAAFESTQYAHYTSEQIVVDGIYAAVRRLGFNGGKTLELGGGVGNFIGLMPDDLKTGTRFTLVERERISARIAKHLYPEQNVQLADATEFRGNDDYYDGAFGNPPFASTPLTDVSGRKHLSGLSVHNYFFAKSVDMLRPGGILAQVVSNSFMDAGRDRARKYIGERTRLLGAIRLPNNAFAKNAGTEVTTDLIFLQKLPEAEWGTKATMAASAAWADLVSIPDPAGGKPIPVNRYFAEHPEMMLGEMGRKGTMYRADMPALVARPGQDTGALLREAVSRLPADVYVPPATAGTASMTASLRQRMADPGVEVGGFFERDGKMFERVEDEAGESMVREITPATQWTEKTTLGDIRFDRIKQLASMRVTLRALIAAEMAGENRMQPGVLRQKLNEQYDAYVKDHGLINDKPTIQAFGEDPDYPLLASLENDFKPGMGAAAAKTNGIKPFKATAKKAPIFTRSVVAARRQVAKATTPADALAVSMAERGRIDAAYMSQLLGKDAESILSDLASGDRPLLFKDPAANEYVLRDAYLSGNVRKKLEQAKAANMFGNVRALEEVQPADVGVHEIHVRTGSPWVPTDVFEDFAKAILGEGTQARIGYLPLTSGFMVRIKPGNEVAETNTYGTPKMGASEILDALLNNRAIKITYTGADKKTYTDKEGTEAANLKAAEIRDKFQDWVFADPERAEVLARAYNDENNNYVTRQYDGTMMTFPGKVPDEIIKFRKHQRNAIARIVQDRTALLDHVVGAGKTFTVIAAAMELKRTGLAKKSMIAVPNHLVKQWAADFYRLYPGANILAATKKDFQGPNRRRFLARIATGDWDAVILAHSSFGFIAPSPEFEQVFNERQVADIMATIQSVKNEGDEKDPKNKRRIKQLAKMKEGLEQRIKSLRDRPMDSLLDFGQLGVDQLFVDEAHLFKNLMFTTKMQGVSGLGDGTGSQRAYDMYVKTQQIMEANGRGQGVVFATGTPISNSLAEMYHMQRYLMPAAMVEGGFQSFDAWANTYASVDQVWMQKISGDGFKVQNRMSTFVNTPELLKMFDQVSDTVTMDDIKKAYAEENDGAEFPLPKLKTGRRQPVSLAKSPGQEAFMKEIAARAQKLEQRKGPPQKGDDNHLTVMGDARKAAMDIRLVKPEVMEREAGGRIDRATDEVVARYKQYDAQKGTQVVFSDLGTPLKHAKAELAEYAALKARADRLEDEALVAASQLGDKAAADALEDAQEAADQIEAKGPDWLDAAKAAERGFSVYDDFRAALIEKGIPAEEIAFIHDYNTDDQKAALFRKMNAGQIRVLMGSTPKLGAGTNVQERMVALHHLDVPWKPSDVEQREGRIIRQGNVLATVPTADRPNPFYIPGFEVEVLAYVTRDTLDMRMWQIQEAKLKMINQLRERNVGREVDNAFQDMEMSAGEMQAAATGNMDLLREIQLRNDVKLLEQKKRAFDAQRSDLASRRKEAQRKLDTLPRQIAELEPWVAAYDGYAQGLQEDRPVDVTVNGKRYTSRSEAQTALRELTSAHEQRLEERRAIIKNNNGAELTEDDRAKMQAQADALLKKGTPADTEEGNRLLNVLATVKPVPKMPKLAVEFNGETYGSTAAVAEAFTEATGDSSRIDWTFEGKTYIRRTAIAKALQPVVAKAVQTDTERAVGGFGPYSVTVEGNTDKYGKALDVQVELAGKVRSRQARLGGNKDSDADPSKTASDVVESVAMGLVSGVRSELEYARYNLQRAQKAMADLDATAAPDSAWPGEAELEKARAAHREVLQRLASGGAKPQADDGMGGSTNLDQTGSPAANETDVLFADLSRVGAQIARQGYERADVKRMQAARRLQGILADKAAGKLTPEEFDAAVAALADQMADVSATKQANRLMAERQRGADILREKLIRARRTGDLDPDAVGLGLWLLDKNPDIASDLSVSILSPKDDSPAGDYNPATRVIRLFKETGNADTIAHEILHHAERMMPPELQAPIRTEWAKQVEAGLKAAKDQPAVLAALQDMLAAAAGNRDAYQRTVQAFKDGVLDYGQHYQLYNPSEFWAVNGARILAGRYGAQGSWVAQAGQWLRDLVQYIRGALGLRSDAPVLRALANVTDPANFGPERGGDFMSQDMLSQGDDERQSLGFKTAFSQAGASLRDVHLPANYRVGDFFNTDGRISWWHKTVGTMHNLAARSPLFKRTYDAVQNFVNDVSFYATEAANEAPRILPKLDKWRDVFKSPLSPEQAKAIAAPIFEGTLTWARDISGKPVKVADLEAAAATLDVHQKAQELLRRDMVDPRTLRMWQGLPMSQYESIIETKYAKEALKPGLVWRDSELKSMFGLTEGEDGTISLYREARRAIDKSLNNLAIADMLRLGGDDVASMRERALASGDPMKVAVMLRDRLYELAAEQPDRANVLNDTGNRMIDKADQVGDLKDRGYAPLSRFGQYTLDVVDDTGERVYFGLFESAAERAKMARQMRENFPGASIESGTVSQEEYRLFAGVSPETLELFGEFLGLEADGGDAASKAFQTYIKLTKSTRSAMKRLIERKGIDGFSEDVGRVLAGFVYSNARQTSSNLHQGEIAESVAAFPKGPGQMKDAAVQLMEYVKNPQEEAQVIRGWLFAQYLGGSVASALVNMTQPATVTLPYLSQFGGATKAAKRVASAARIVNKESTGDAALDKALKVAEETGVVSPQEVHQLQAQAMGRATLRTGDGTRVGDAYAKGMNKLAILGFAWGKLFGMAEQVNRRITFIAAYRTAVDEGMPNPAKFATQAVTETQFTYNKGNKPRWARGAVGSVLFTFKQYSISYLELMNRMWNAGDEGSPERAAGRKAVLLAMAVLFLAGGADGLPFMEDAEDVLDAFMQRLGYNFSSKQARHEFLADVLGDGGARFVANGLSGLPGAPLDVSGRMGMGNLIPGTGLLPKKADHTRDATEVIGPMGDFVKRGFQAVGQLVDGEPVKAIQTISPVAARNAAKAVDMANTGMYRDDRGRKVIDTDGYDALIKAIGFQPNDVARVQESTGMVQNLIAQNKLRESEIAEKWAIGIFEGDQDKQAEARAELARWNSSNPTAKIKIEMPQILKRVRAMRQSKAERLEKTAPKEIRAQVKAELAGAAQ